MLFAFTRDTAGATAAVYFFGSIALACYFAPTFAVIQNLVDVRMRASASALMFLSINLFGQGLGPTVMGLFSDITAKRLFAGDFFASCPGGAAPKGSAAELTAACAHASSVGLRQAILASTVFFAWGALHYLFAARSIRRELGSRAGAVAGDAPGAA